MKHVFVSYLKINTVKNVKLFKLYLELIWQNRDLNIVIGRCLEAILSL